MNYKGGIQFYNGGIDGIREISGECPKCDIGPQWGGNQILVGEWCRNFRLVMGQRLEGE